MLQKWTIIKEEDISPSRWMPVLRHSVQLPDQTIVNDYYFSPLGNVAMVMAITTAGEIVLVRQYKHGLGEILIELPGGMQHGHTTMEACAVAELEEETGIKVDESALISLGKIAGNPTKTNQVTYGYIVKEAVFNARQKLDNTEAIELLTVTPGKLIEMVANGEIWVADTVSFIMKARLLHPGLFS